MIKTTQEITSINGFYIGDKVRLKDGDGRPHIIKSFSLDGLKEFFFRVRFEDDTETMLDNIARLPSNLDEAAVIYINTPRIKSEKDRVFNEISRNHEYLAFKAGAEWMAGQGWHNVTETPSIFGFYLVIHEKGWCVAYYMGKGVVCKSGWVEAIHHVEIEHPQKWLDLMDLIPKKQ